MQNTFSLPSELTIYTLAELHPQWLGWVNGAAHAEGTEGAQPNSDEIFRVSAAAVAEVDSAGVQLLLSLSNALARQQRTLRLVNPSPPLANACAALGLLALLANAELAGATQ